MARVGHYELAAAVRDGAAARSEPQPVPKEPPHEHCPHAHHPGQPRSRTDIGQGRGGTEDRDRRGTDVGRGLDRRIPGRPGGRPSAPGERRHPRRDEEAPPRQEHDPQLRLLVGPVRPLVLGPGCAHPRPCTPGRVAGDGVRPHRSPWPAGAADLPVRARAWARGRHRPGDLDGGLRARRTDDPRGCDERLEGPVHRPPRPRPGADRRGAGRSPRSATDRPGRVRQGPAGHPDPR